MNYLYKWNKNSVINFFKLEINTILKKKEKGDKIRKSRQVYNTIPSRLREDQV